MGYRDFDLDPGFLKIVCHPSYSISCHPSVTRFGSWGCLALPEIFTFWVVLVAILHREVKSDWTETSFLPPMSPGLELGCLSNRLFKLTAQNTSKLHIAGHLVICRWLVDSSHNSQWASNVKRVSMSWCHNDWNANQKVVIVDDDEIWYEIDARLKILDSFLNSCTQCEMWLWIFAGRFF